jgi:tetratricopeptide (TPR) repeat protein
LPENNELLGTTRRRIESPTSPGQSMTRHELAEAVNAHVRRSTRNGAAVDARHIGRWERGQIAWPAHRYRAAMRAVLNVATDADLGFHRSRRTTVDDVDRKTFLKATMGAGTGVLLSSTLPVSSGSDADLIAVLSGPTTYYRRMESSVPSDQLSPAVDAHLNLVASVVRDRLRMSAGYRLLSEVAGLAAWLAADRGDNATARLRYGQAIRHAEQTHHPTLTAYMTASLGHFATESGDSQHGLTLLRRATAQLDDNAPDSAHAWLSSLSGVAYAALGDRTHTLSALRRAERLASRQHGEPRWPWVFTFDAAKAARYQANALRRLGDLRQARNAYVAATPALTAAKPLAFAKVEHADVRARMGDVAGGCALAIEALSVGRAYGSERIASRVREFRAALPAQTVEARRLDSALAALYEHGQEA